MTDDEQSDVRNREIGFIFQGFNLIPSLTAMENVEIKNQLTHHKHKQQIMDWFEALGLADKMDARVGQMSFGQQQRVAMIRALVQPFDFLLADEPVSHLDDANNQIVAQMVTREAQAQGAGIISTSVGNNVRINVDKEFKL